MKRLYIALALCLGITGLYAQTDPLRDKLDNVFYYIDKSQVPTGILEEYGPALVPLDVFNGITSDSNKVNIDLWRSAYQTLYASRIYGTNALPALATVNASIANMETLNNTKQHITRSGATGAIPVSILYSPYNYLRPDAIDANLLSVSNDQLYDVPGRSQSPYNTRSIFIATPTVGYAHNGTVSLIFKQELFYNFSGKTANNLQVDFADGNGYQSASWNTTVTSYYNIAGTKNIKIKITFTDNSSVECYSILEIIELNTGNPLARYGAPTSPNPITVPFPATVNHSGGTLFIEYDKNDTERTLNKPLIIVEGYDVSSIGPKLQDNYSFQDFVTDLNVNFNATQNFNTQLDDIAGYDLVFLDFNNGTDDIVRNAALVQQVIQWVNDNKAGSEQNVVMGISMGGLVGRYALANMTKQSLNPQTRLLITHDSPHRGANTPLGLQFLTRQVNEVGTIQTLNLFNILPSIEQANALLDQPATQQLLIARAINGSGSVSYNSFLDGDYRSMITFPANGPQPAYRMIATSLGSECGQPNLNPGTELLHINGNFLFAPFPWLDRAKFNTEVIINALPALGQSQLLSKLHIWSTFTILRVIHINIDHVNKSANSPSNLLPWDGAPGGGQDVASQAGQIPNVNFPKPFAFLTFSIGATFFPGNFCFVPTVSALDVTTIDQPALSRVYAGGISPANPSRMATFIAQEQINGNSFNQRHPRFTARNANWLFNQMENLPNNNLNCPALCQIDYSNLTITGPSGVCNSGSTFTLNNVSAGANITWQATPANLFAVSSGSGNSATLTPVNSGVSGNGFLTFSVNAGCGPVPVQKAIWISRPYVGVTYNVGYQASFNPYPNYNDLPITYNMVCNLVQTPVSVTVSGASNGNWQKISSNPSNVSWSSNGNNLSFYLYSVNQTVLFRHSATNACGVVASDFYFKSQNCGGGGGGGGCNQFSVSPISSSSTVNIVVPNIPPPCNSVSLSAVTESNQEVEVKNDISIAAISLIDSEGQEKHSQYFFNKSKKVDLDVSKMKKGIYILKISSGQYIETHRIVVE